MDGLASNQIIGQVNKIIFSKNLKTEPSTIILKDGTIIRSNKFWKIRTGDNIRVICERKEDGLYYQKDISSEYDPTGKESYRLSTDKDNKVISTGKDFLVKESKPIQSGMTLSLHQKSPDKTNSKEQNFSQGTILSNESLLGNGSSRTTPSYLAKRNKHPRDENIIFQEDGHIYTIMSKMNAREKLESLLGSHGHPVSVTTLIHNYFPKFNADLIIGKMMKSRNWPKSKYFGKTKEQIKEEWDNNGKGSSNLGTLMHADIENYYNQDDVLNNQSKEFQYFIKFWEGFQIVNPGFEPYRTEWLIYDENENIAGSVDCVLADKHRNMVILDWKRSKEIKFTNEYEKGLGPFCDLDNCNYNHYMLQLNIYRHILETKYDGKIVGMFIVVLHPDNNNFIVHSIPKYDIASIWANLFTHKSTIQSDTNNENLSIKTSLGSNASAILNVSSLLETMNIGK